MKRSKSSRVISLFIALVLCLSCVPASSVFAVGEAADSGQWLEKLDVQDIDTLSGFLYERANANFDRLESSQYSADRVAAGDPSWPGDLQGRILLGLISQAKTLHGREPQTLQAVLDAVEGQLIDGAFLNKKLDPDMANEQLFSGHSWFLRAMCELYEWNQDPKALEIINNLTDKLLIAGKAAIERYPIEHISGGGDVSGEIIGRENGWELSTDTGCVFMMLDGSTHAYQITHNPQLKAVIEALIEKFMAADVTELKFQTHATLSATRGLLRFYQETKEQKYLDFAVQRMNEYLSGAMTEAYMNYNWYQRPEWTEPCGIIDSYIASMELFRFTQDTRWLEQGQEILYSGLAASQRSNGGFGTDSCVGVSNGSLNMHSYEATQCCTMRGGEGTTKAIGYQYLTDQGGALYALQYGNNQIRFSAGNGVVQLKEQSNYPEEGSAVFTVEDAGSCDKLPLRLFIPSFVTEYQILVDGAPVSAELENGFASVTIDPQKQKTVSVSFDLPVTVRSTMEQSGHLAGLVYAKGFAELGWFNGPAADSQEAELPFSQRTLTPLYERFHLSPSELQATSVQLVADRPNFAQSADALASSGDPAPLNDGSHSTGWACGGQAGPGAEQWAGLDLGRVCPVDIITVYPASDAALIPGRYTVQISSDNVSWKTVFETQNTDVPGNAQLAPKTEARYIRVTCDQLKQQASGDYAAGLGEIELYSAAAKVLSITSDISSIADQVSINGGAPKTVPCQELFFSGSEVTLELLPNTGHEYSFFNWSGAADSEDTAITVRVEEDTNLIVNHGYSGLHNVAFGKTVTANNKIESSPNWMPRNLTDGIYAYPNSTGSNGYTSQGFSNQDVSGQPITLEVDLGSDQEFDVIKLYPRSDAFAVDGTTGSFPEDFTISVRKDGSGENVAVKSLTGEQAPFGGPAVYTLEEPQNARYITVTVTRLGKAVADNPSTHYFQLSELVAAKASAGQREKTLTIQGTEGSSVFINGVRCSLPYQHTFPHGSRVEVQAVEDGLYAFESFTGDLFGDSPVQKLYMNDDRNLTLTMSKGVRIPNSQVTASATSETNPPDSINGPASYAIDDDPATIWHTDYRSSGPSLPQSLTLTFQALTNVFQVVYLPRTDTDSKNGIFQQYLLEGLLEDGTWSKLAEGEWPGNNDPQTIPFPTTAVSAIRITALQAVGGYASCAELQVYADNRVLEEADKTILGAVLRYAKDAKGTDEYKHVIPSVKTSFDAALAAAQSVYDKADAAQAQVDSAWTALMKEIHKLGFQAGDKTKLQADYGIYSKWNLADYPDGTEKDAFAAALAQADKVLRDEDAMAGEIEQADAALIAAADALAAVVKTDKTSLTATVEQANSCAEDNYVTAGWAQFAAARSAAQAVLGNPSATQKQIDDANAALVDAMLVLRYKADKSILNELISAAAGLDLSAYTAASVDQFSRAYDSAKAVSSNPALSEDDQDVVDDAVTALTRAIEALEPADGSGGITVNGDGTLNQTGGSVRTGESAPIAAAATAIALAGMAVIAAKRRKK